jgi:hypothetical protein
MGEYDKTIKLLMDTNPEALFRFVLNQWRRHMDRTLPETPMTVATQLNVDFQSADIEGDNLLLIAGPDGPSYLAEIEFQSTLDTTMSLRSLAYCVQAKKKHGKNYGHLPIIAVVIYLFDDAKNVPEPPLHWSALNGATTMDFYSLSIHLKNLSREELLAWPDQELRPLALLTDGPVDRIIVSNMLTELRERKLNDVLPIVCKIASWRMDESDQEWLKQERNNMHDVTKDTAYEIWEKDYYRGEAQKEAQQQVLAAQKEAQQQVLAAQKEAQQQALAAQKKNLEMFQQTVVELVSQRFPQLKPLAKIRVRATKKPEDLQQMLLRLSLTLSAEEAENVLYTLEEDEEHAE